MENDVGNESKSIKQEQGPGGFLGLIGPKCFHAIGVNQHQGHDEP